LLYWMMISSFYAFGVSEWTARSGTSRRSVDGSAIYWLVVALRPKTDLRKSFRIGVCTIRARTWRPGGGISGGLVYFPEARALTF
jgi:hypothetical protein